MVFRHLISISFWDATCSSCQTIDFKSIFGPNSDIAIYDSLVSLRLAIVINTPDDARDQNSHGLVVTVMCKTDTVVISPGLATVPQPKCHLEIIEEPLLHDVCKGPSTSVVGIVGSSTIDFKSIFRPTCKYDIATDLSHLNYQSESI